MQWTNRAWRSWVTHCILQTNISNNYHECTNQIHCRRIRPRCQEVIHASSKSAEEQQQAVEDLMAKVYASSFKLMRSIVLRTFPTFLLDHYMFMEVISRLLIMNVLCGHGKQRKRFLGFYRGKSCHFINMYSYSCSLLNQLYIYIAPFYFARCCERKSDPYGRSLLQSVLMPLPRQYPSLSLL